MASRFRTSFTSREGFEPAELVQCRVMNVNLVNWTVDVISQFDRKRYFEIQVASPYLHYNSGEGAYIVPEVGAVCMVAIPSDSSPPFVLSFLMPHTFVDSGTPDAPNGMAQQQGGPQQFATGASFDGGRKAPKPGDFVFRTRDGNFLMLHRGGVLQVGATELAQRIYIPLGNLITDISENFAHHNSSGSIRWGWQEGPSQAHFPSEYMHTFRVFADDAAADVRVLIGNVRRTLGEPSNGDQTDLGALEIGDDPENNPVVCEVAVSKLGFVTGTGETASNQTAKNAIFRFFFDRKGGTFLRCNGSLLISSKKKLKLKSTEEMELEAKSIFLKAADGIEISGGAFTHVKGDLVRMGPGTRPVAHQGAVVTVVFPPGLIPIAGTATPAGVVTGFIMGGQAIGTVTSGEPSVLV